MDKRVDLILQQLEELPTLPTVALRVLEVTGRDDSSAKDVVALIESDPALSARILKLLHRSDLGVSRDVASIERAVVLLGFETVRSAVLAVSVFQTLGGETDVQGAKFQRTEFWKHCLGVACAAELLAEQLGKPTGFTSSDAMICGLLHDLGKIAMDAALPKSFARVIEASEVLRGNIADIERQVVGIDHNVVGKRLAERWQLPSSIRDCIWLHGQTPEALPQSVINPRLVNLITLADILVRELHLGYSGNYQIVPHDPWMAAAGLSDEQVQTAMGKLVVRLEDRAAALGLGESSSGEIYQRALATANRELGRVSTQLATRNRKLAVRARFFDALNDFQSELRPDAPPQLVIEAIGQTAVDILQVRCVAVFSLAPTRDLAEVMLFDESGESFESTIVECPARPARPSEGEGPVFPAAQEMEWLIAQISPRLPGDQRFWMCLSADGKCIGGVAWGAQLGEGERRASQARELSAVVGGWSLALRTAQIREESRNLLEQLAESNRKLQSTQAELLKSRTMMAIGEMAKGAAHEMNNPLAVISGRAQLLAGQLSDPKQKLSADMIHQNAQRLSDIITELMDYAKPQPPTLANSDLVDLISHALHDAKMLTEPADRKIELTIGEVPPVKVDAQQVRAALVEVIDNALQATDDRRGWIELHAAHDRLTQKVVLTIADNGCGMDEHTLRHAFDPFFSAKPAGRRRGMGLPKALRWIEASGGSIRIESRKGEGTRMIVLLPTVQAPPPAAQSRKKAANS